MIDRGPELGVGCHLWSRSTPATSTPTRSRDDESGTSHVLVRGADGKVHRTQPNTVAAQHVRQSGRTCGGRTLSPARHSTTYARLVASYDRDLVDRIDHGGADPIGACAPRR